MKASDFIQGLIITCIIVFSILTCMILLNGCESVEVETKKIVDYRHVDQYTETYTDFERRFDWSKDDWVTYPVTKTRVVKEHYELCWEYTYTDGSTRREWEECTRFEYEDAKGELEK